MERPARPALASQNIDNMLNSRAEFTVPRRLGPTVQVRDAMITFRPAAVNHGSAPDLSVVHPSRSEPHPPSSISFEKTSAGPRRYVKSSPRFSKGRRRRSRRCARPRPSATLGDAALAEACAELERIRRTGTMPDVSWRVAAIEALYQVVSVPLRAEVDQPVV